MMSTSLASILGVMLAATGHVVAAWLIVAVVVVAYALWVIARGRRVSGEIPPEDRRFL